MSGYLVIESQNAFERGVPAYLDAAATLARHGEPVTLFLVQNGVLPAGVAESSAVFEALSLAGVEILADEFSLRERGIKSNGLAPGVRMATLERVAQQVAVGRRTIWR